jgi:hypothetical protein
MWRISRWRVWQAISAGEVVRVGHVSESIAVI